MSGQVGCSRAGQGRAGQGRAGQQRSPTRHTGPVLRSTSRVSSCGGWYPLARTARLQAQCRRAGCGALPESAAGCSAGQPHGRNSQELHTRAHVLTALGRVVHSKLLLQPAAAGTAADAARPHTPARGGCACCHGCLGLPTHCCSASQQGQGTQQSCKSRNPSQPDFGRSSGARRHSGQRHGDDWRHTNARASSKQPQNPFWCCPQGVCAFHAFFLFVLTVFTH